MAEQDEQNQSSAQDTQQETSSTPEEKGGNKSLFIIIGIIIAILLILFLVFRNNQTVQKVISPIINVTPATSMPSESPSPTSTGIGQGDSTISGSVTLKGDIPSGAKLAVSGQSVTNPGYAPIVGQLAVQDGATWEWDKAVQGNTYDVQAHLLDSSGSLIAQSPVQQVVAPKQSVVLAISYADLPAPPASSITAECVEQNSDGLWQAEITYNINNPTSSASQYRVGIGTSRSGDLVFDSIVKPTSPDVTQTLTTDYILTTGTTYFAAYAYADCANCDDFSPASQWYQFSCKPAAATATPTPSATPQT